MPRGKYYKSTRQYGFKAGGAVNLRKKQARLDMDVRYLKTLVNSEIHHHQLTLANNIDNNGVIFNLCRVPTGDSVGDRSGTSILPRYMTINFHVNKSLTGPAHETFRVMLFRYWGSETDAAPAVAVGDIFDSANTPNSMLEADNTGKRGDRERRIEVHKSKYFTLDNVSDTSRTWKWNVQINGMNKNVKEHIKYRSTTTEDPVSGGFYLVAISDNGTGANKAALEGISKLGFHDN